uniref:Transcription repressor n=1 Tax=Leersia perrieri TaxID=77586 RepID=A0A0D9WH16_9ORYZ
MVRKLPLSSVFYTINSARDTAQSSSSSSPPPAPAAPPAWMWPSCKHPTRAHSFRSASSSAATEAAAKTIASIFHDSGGESSSFATNSYARMMHGHNDDCCASDSLSTDSTPEASAGDIADAIVRGLRSDRLRFEPRAPSSSILDKKPPVRRAGASDDAASFGGGVAVAFDSEDPYEDFRVSMAEMVAAHGAVGYWDWLEAMLGWYLRANGKETHAAIVAAFVDLVVSMAASRGSSSSSRHSSFTLAGTTDMESSSSSAAAAGHFSFRLR